MTGHTAPARAVVFSPDGRIVASGSADQTIRLWSVTDGICLAVLSEHSGEAIAYRRIGNYAVFVLDVTDAEAASKLMDQVKYEKTVQWLGEDPNLARRLERYLAATTRDILLSTVLVITFGLGLSVIAGIVAGFIFFRVRDQKRLQWQRFSDGGGLTRLNLDELTESEARSLK